jgi:hypothetical protein
MRFKTNLIRNGPWPCCPVPSNVSRWRGHLVVGLQRIAGGGREINDCWSAHLSRKKGQQNTHFVMVYLSRLGSFRDGVRNVPRRKLSLVLDIGDLKLVEEALISVVGHVVYGNLLWRSLVL